MPKQQTRGSRSSLRARLMRRLSSRYFDRIDTASINPRVLRERLDGLTRKLPGPRGVTRRTVSVAGLHAEQLVPEGVTGDGVLLYLHGGAYVMGNCNSHRGLAGGLARAAGVVALLPEYRLAPEYRYPHAVDDAVSVYRSLVEDGHAPSSIIIAGDSAGGGLTMATLLALRKAGDQLPAGAFLLSPWTDLTASGESMRTNHDRDPWFRRDGVMKAATFYCDESELRDPLVSPVFADMHDLPPVHIQVGDLEVLLSDSTRVVDRIIAAGGNAEVEIWPGMWHVFQAFYPVVPEAQRAIMQMAAKMRAVLSEA
ncbi:MAG: alpha/beta hydrolase [Woeseiaceae bacterium]